jgi:protein associated with RNAse G/E
VSTVRQYAIRVVQRRHDVSKEDSEPTRRLTRALTVHVCLTYRGRVRLEYDAVVLDDDGDHVIVQAPWAEAAPRDLGYVKFTHGDVITEHYWRNRWYSIKEIRNAEGVRKGWYCDVTRPAEVGDSSITSDDLDLDVWVSADRGTILILDEDEFEVSGLQESDPEAAARAREALHELEEHARMGFTDLLSRRHAQTT